MKQKHYIDELTKFGPHHQEKGKGRKNIFLISMDMVPPEFYDETDGILRTPNIDSLKSESTWFRNTFSTSPLCTPSRASYLTGRYSYITGNSERSRDGHTIHLRDSDIIWPEYLKSSGYHVRHVGKSHVGKHKFIDVFSENDSPWDRWSPPWYDDDDFIEFLNRKGLQRYSFARSIHGANWKGEGKGNDYGGWLADQNGKPFPKNAVYPAYLVEKAKNAVESRKDREDPIYLQLDFFGPHQPFAIPYGFEEREKQIREQLTLPQSYLDWKESGFGEIEEDPRVYNMYRQNWGLYDEKTLIDYKVANILQYELLDQMVGEFLDYLKASRLYEDSWIFFIADHGEMNGEKGCIDKGAYLNPQVLQVPLIMKPPKDDTLQELEYERGTAVSQICSLLDICPTVLEIAGIHTDDHLDGQSLLDTLRQVKADSGSRRTEEFPLLADIWNHVIPNPAVSSIFEASDGNIYQITYNMTSAVDELYRIPNVPKLHNCMYDEKYAAIRKEALHHLDAVLADDTRWQAYSGYFRLQYAEELNIEVEDTQKFFK
ncbi:MAG: sulfatase-like hydrolase/transferase [Proteiniphilum sp.]|nr:sulfatase-like hydrolase/transferase [Proteiniphilum sp.]